tara:strand:- start:817 stop:2409 length:1593 start_codon:yes stop_codon:yes gene_type:complete
MTIAVIMAVPIISVLGYALVPEDAAWSHLRQTTLWPYATNTAALMGLVAILSLTIGVSTAWLVAATDFPGRRLFGWLLVLPLAAPGYVIAYLYTDLLTFSGPIQAWLRDIFDWQANGYWFPKVRSLPGAAILLSLVLYPYIYLLARASFSSRAGVQFEAARTMGLNAWQAFFRVALPSARPAIVGGLALVMMETLADFGVVDYFAIPTFSTGIFRTWFSMGEKVAALKLAGVMLIFVALLVVIESVNRKGRYDDGSSAARYRSRICLSPVQGISAFVICSIPVLLGFAVPVAVLAVYSFQGGDQLFGGGFMGFAWNSIRVAVVAAILALILAITLAYAERLSSTRLIKVSIRLSTLGYALPGTLLAVALLGPVSGIDRALTGFLSDSFDWEGGLVLTGTVALLIYAYAVRFLTVSFNAVSSSLARVPPTMDAVARSLGSAPLSVFRHIHLPLIRPGVAAAALLVFVDVMRELPATLILRPFNFETLATRVYRLASDERLSEASTAAVMIVLIGLLPVITLYKLGQSRMSE